MRIIFIILIGLCLWVNPSQACPICGCGGGNFYMGLMPNFKSRFLGIRYHDIQFHTQLFSDPTQHSLNEYHSLELWGGWNLSRKWQVLAFIPYHFNKQVDDDGTTYKNGIGDISFLVNYQLLRQRGTASGGGTREQELWLGAGLKLPTGSFRVNVNDSSTTIADINSQIGTGSTDVLVNLSHHFRINHIGINTNLHYKWSTPNADQYRFGNKFAATTLGYYQLPSHGQVWAPNAGLNLEVIAANSLRKQAVSLTGGYSLCAIAGLEWQVKGISLGVNGQVPLSQNFAGGQTHLQFRAMAHVTFVF